jgi:hypothetical protein
LQQVPRVVDWDRHGYGFVSGHDIDQLVFDFEAGFTGGINSSHEDGDQGLTGIVQRYLNHYTYNRASGIENR